ncbi:alpha/beta hydrolase [Sesbania bispinosa]|nr:alpha/beta hydrolase [Sesbania bispinosa]
MEPQRRRLATRKREARGVWPQRLHNGGTRKGQRRPFGHNRGCTVVAAWRERKPQLGGVVGAQRHAMVGPTDPI